MKKQDLFRCIGQIDDNILARYFAIEKRYLLRRNQRAFRIARHRKHCCKSKNR